MYRKQAGRGPWNLVAVAFTALSIAPPVYATGYAVPGDFATIQAALDAAVAGDTITVSGGPYNEKIHFPASGNAGQGYLTLQAASGQTPIIDGTGKVGDNIVLIDTRSYVKLIGFELRNNLGVTDGSGVRVLGSGTNIEIRNNVIHDIRGQNAMGITVYATDPSPISNLIIDGNTIFDCEPKPSETLTLNGNVTDFAVTNNTVHDVNNIGIDFIGGEKDIQPDSTKVARNGVCRGNTVLRAREGAAGGYAGGIYIDGGRDIVVERNIVSGCDLGIEVGAENAGIVASGNAVRDNLVFTNEKAGIVFGGYSPGVGRSNDNQFLNNTCYHNDTLSAGYGELWIQYGTGNAIKNNIFVSTAQNILLASYGGNAGNILDDNVWFTSAGSGAGRFIWNDIEYTGFTAYRSAIGQDGNSLFADPLFVSAAANDFHLTSASPAINAGDPAFVPAPGELDIDGAARVDGGRVDAGADEAGSCGNGTIDPGEQCDDGNLTDCDGCDSNCTLTACGNGIVCGTEQCDDGNTTSGDCCSAGCQFEAAASPCTDGNLCTRADACDGSGHCAGVDAPEPTCLQPVQAGKAMVLIKDKTNDKSDRVLWKWTKGGATALAALGDPLHTTTYAMCVYDETAGVAHIAVRLTVPPGSDWEALGASGFHYRDPAAGADGVQSLQLIPGVAGRAKILLKAKGVNLPALPLPLAADPQVTVQLKNSTGACWAASFAPPFRRNDSGAVKGRSE